MCDLLVAGDKNAFEEDGISKTVYDMTMGTSQMLTCMEERLKALDAEADINVFVQEFNPFTFGIAKADMLIRGGDPDNMQFGDTLSDDKFTGYEFDYIISIISSIISSGILSKQGKPFFSSQLYLAKAA